jgi:hypothetical protein
MKPFETAVEPTSLKTRLGALCETASANELEEILRSYIVGGLEPIVDLVVNNPDLWQDTLENSYRHANGFHKIVLLQGPNFKLRLHHFVSPHATPPPAEHIHDHRWPFASHIINGNLNMDLFQAQSLAAESSGAQSLAAESSGAQSPTRTHAFLYDSAKDGGGFNATYEGLRNLVHLKNVTYEQGTTYHMHPEEMHRIVANADPCTTLMLTGKPVSKFCHFYAASIPSFEQTRTIPYTSKELNAILSSILEIQKE